MANQTIPEKLTQYIHNSFNEINTFKTDSGVNYITFNHQGQRHILSKSKSYIMRRIENTSERKEQYINVTNNDNEIMDVLVAIKSGYIVIPNKFAISLQTNIR